MKKRVIGVVAVAGVLALSSSARSQDQSPFAFTQFSATMVMNIPGQEAGAAAHIYRSGDKMRTDIGKQGYFLSDLSQHVGYMVMGSAMCMEVHQSDPSHPNPFEMTGKIQRSELGADTIDGHPVKIEQITIESDSGKTVTMKAWEATDLHGFPVRVEVPGPKGTTRMDLKDIDLSTPSASLFATPTNCREMPVMPGMPH